jgi:hypothetical protein
VKEGIFPAHVNETSALRKTLLQIITNEQLKHQSQLPLTNAFILFNRYEPTTNENLSEIRHFKFNKSCKIYTLNFRDTSDFEIFQENYQEVEEEGVLKVKEETAASDNWYQSKTFVKGFNDTLVNNKSIWN